MAPVKFAPWEPAWLQDPWPTYHEMRAEAPVYWSEALGHWVLTRYQDVVAVSKDPRFTATNRPPQRRWGRATMMVTADPPEHSRLRRPVAHHFGFTAVESLAPRMREIVDGLLDAAEERGGMDVAWDYARILPRRIITEMMGVPYAPPVRPQGQLNEFGMEQSEEARRPREAAQTPAMAAAADAGPQGMRRRQPPATTEDVETPQDRWFKEAFAQHRADLRDDAVMALLRAQDGGSMTEEEVLDTSTILYGAGQETTGSLVTNAIYQLLLHPGQMQWLRDHPTMLATAVDELLRFDAPVHAIRRRALVDVEVGRVTIKAGDKALLMLMAANRDPDVFESPDEMRLDRKDNYQIAFGSGPHTCLGGILARAEAQAAIGGLVARFPKLRLTKPARYQGSMVLRMVRDLPVEVT